MAAASNADIRAWAREHGYAVSERGRLPAEVMAAYTAAHREPAAAEPAEGRYEAAGRAAAPPHHVHDEEASSGAAPPPPPGPRQWAPDRAAWGPPPPPPAPPAWQSQGPGPAWAAPGPPPPPAAPGTDGLAIAALVLGIIPLLAGILGIIFGVIALARIRRSHQGGRGYAIAGIAAGTAWLVLIGGLVAVGLVTGFGDAERADDGSVIGRGTLTVDDLRTGDCSAPVPSGATLTIEVVPCREPHGAEVYATFHLTGAGYPGEAEVTRFAEGGCRERLPSYVGPANVDRFEIVFFHPTGETWRRGDREVACLLTAPGGGKLPPGSAKSP